jgi:hypothetical protein
MSAMVELTPHDSAALSRLVRFERLPPKKRLEILEEIQADDARRVGEIVLDPQKLAEATPEVQATVARFRQWQEANRRLARDRAKRQRVAQARRSPATAISQP